MDRGTRRFECVDGPVPAVRRLEYYLRVRAGLLDLQSQRHRIVDDPYRRQLFTLRRRADDHRPLPVQIDPDDLFSVILAQGASSIVLT